MNDIGMISLIGGFIIAGLTILGNIVVSILTKKYEFKKALFTTTIDCAYKEYEYNTNLVQEIAHKEGLVAELVPFTDYLIFYSRLALIMGSKKITKEKIDKALQESNIAIKSLREKNKK